MQQEDFLNLKGIDYIEFYVGNVRQATHFYRTALGFTPVAYSGLETGTRDRTSIVINQRNIWFVLTGALSSDSPITDHLKLHGDGVKDIAFSVDDAASAFHETVKRGATAVMEPTVFETDQGRMTKATIAAYGDTLHSFIQREGFDHSFLPGYQQVRGPASDVEAGLAAIDHIAISLPPGQLDNWVGFYKQVMGFNLSHQEDVATEYSAMNSKVVQNKSGRIKFPMMEPAPGKRKSQIEEYLDFYEGPGAQHVAMISADIMSAVRTLRGNNIDFLQTPRTYYEALPDRVGKVEEELDTLRELGILIDRDKWGYLMQVFTKPLLSRPTVFFEVIQRKGARGFGGGNIKALFEAVERDQAERGNL
jgi:4-hydroxyphenylpyruvate dioxygenase